MPPCATVLALLLALCQGSPRPGGLQEALGDVQKQETLTRSALVQDLVKPDKKHPGRRSKRGVWGVLPEKLNTFGKLDSHVKQTLVSEIKLTQLAFKKSQVQNLVNYLLRRRSASALKKSRVQNILEKLNKLTH